MFERVVTLSRNGINANETATTQGKIADTTHRIKLLTIIEKVLYNMTTSTLAAEP